MLLTNDGCDGWEGTVQCNRQATHHSYSLLMLSLTLAGPHQLQFPTCGRVDVGCGSLQLNLFCIYRYSPVRFSGSTFAQRFRLPITER